MIDMDEKLLTRKQAAEYLQVNVRTIDRWIRAGLVRIVRLPEGRTIRIPASEIVRIMQAAPKAGG